MKSKSSKAAARAAAGRKCTSKSAAQTLAFIVQETGPFPAHDSAHHRRGRTAGRQSDARHQTANQTRPRRDGHPPRRAAPGSVTKSAALRQFAQQLAGAAFPAAVFAGDGGRAGVQILQQRPQMLPGRFRVAGVDAQTRQPVQPFGMPPAFDVQFEMFPRGFRLALIIQGLAVRQRDVAEFVLRVFVENAARQLGDVVKPLLPFGHQRGSPQRRQIVGFLLQCAVIGVPRPPASGRRPAAHRPIE